MSEAIIVALITGLVAVIGSVLAFIVQSKQLKIQSEELSTAQKKAYEEKIEKLNESITQKLEEHREEYLAGIHEVKNSITDMNAVYQQTVAVVELKIDSLEKKQDKHNNIIERTYRLESDVEVLKEKQSVANHRIEDLERKS